MRFSDKANGLIEGNIFIYLDHCMLNGPIFRLNIQGSRPMNSK